MEGEGNYHSAISAFEKARTIATDFGFAAVEEMFKMNEMYGTWTWKCQHDQLKTYPGYIELLKKLNLPIDDSYSCKSLMKKHQVYLLHY